MRKRFVTTCVNSTGPAIREMLNSSKNVTRRTFLRHVDRKDMLKQEAACGYSQHPKQGLTMAADRHVSYSVGKYQGQPCAFFTWSAIEYVFCGGDRTQNKRRTERVGSKDGSGAECSPALRRTARATVIPAAGLANGPWLFGVL